MADKHCPRCGGLTAVNAKKGSLCESCRHSSGNGQYVWDRAKREVARLAREELIHPELTYDGPWVVRGGIRRPA